MVQSVADGGDEREKEVDGCVENELPDFSDIRVNAS